jgi:hypothetical protein
LNRAAGFGCLSRWGSVGRIASGDNDRAFVVFFVEIDDGFVDAEQQTLLKKFAGYSLIYLCLYLCAFIYIFRLCLYFSDGKDIRDVEL